MSSVFMDEGGVIYGGKGLVHGLSVWAWRGAGALDSLFKNGKVVALMLGRDFMCKDTCVVI